MQDVVSQLKVHSEWFDEVITSPPRLLFYRGRFIRETMRRSRVSEEALRTTARQHGLGSLQKVEAIVLETNGTFSLIKTGQAGDASALEDIPTASDGEDAAARLDE